MAAVRSFWLKQQKERASEGMAGCRKWWKGCIFQHVWREACLANTEGLRNTNSLQLPHLSFLANLLLDHLLNHRFDAALECMVGLCGVCKKIPELFWRVGCEVLIHAPGSDIHMTQFVKSMFVLCVPFREELLLDYAMYLIKHNSDITEACEMLAGKMHQPPFITNHLLRAYLGLLEFLLWKKDELKMQKRNLEDQSYWGVMADNSQHGNLKRQMDFHAKKALSLFHDLVENIGVWDIFIVKQVELLKYYNRTDDGRKIFERYKEKNPENPNAHRYLYYFLKTENAAKEELCSVLKGLLAVDPTSELSKEYVQLTNEISETDDSLKMHNALEALFIKLDHAACRQNTQDWEMLASLLRQTISVHGRSSLNKLWSERADWWPGFHFRADLVPTKCCVTDQEWELTRHKAEVARCLLGEGNRFVMAVGTQEGQFSDDEDMSLRVSISHAPRKRKRPPVLCDSLSPFKKRNK